MTEQDRRMRLSRRSVLLGGTAVGLAAVVAEAMWPAPALASVGFPDLRDRWKEIISGPDQIDPTRPEFAAALALMDKNVGTSLAELSTSTDRVFKNLDLAHLTDPLVPAGQKNSSVLTETYSRLRNMARAWSTAGSVYYESEDLLLKVLHGLRTANVVVYNTDVDYKDPPGNWWDWQIGAEKPLADCLVLLHDRLPPADHDGYKAALRHFVPDPHELWINRLSYPSTGANRVDLCQAALVESIASEDAARVKRAADGLPAVCEYVQEGDGLYADGSFVQHGTVAYTGAYGTTLLGGMAQLLGLLKDTTWQPTDPAIDNLYQVVDLGWAPVIHDGRMMSFVNGRTICRSETNEHRAGQAAIAAILRLAPTAKVEGQAERWRSMCRGWLKRNGRVKEGADVPIAALFAGLLDDSSVVASSEPESSVVLRNMGRAVHRRAGWAFAISMCSDRTSRYESINGENLQGFHTGAGMTYLYDEDADQYTDFFWPTVDPYQLPGTTTEQLTLVAPTGTGPATSRWAGGPVLDGRYAAVGMRMSAATTDLSGKKSWFCFDEYVVALGAGIKSTNERPVYTCIENRNLHKAGTPGMTVNGSAWDAPLNTTRTWTDAQWVHVDGVAGYVFPSARALTADFRERQGSYRLIDADGDPTPDTRRYLTLRHDHGVNPNGASYAYVLAPKATAERTAQLAASSGVSFQSNNSNCQAVKGPGGILMFNFWTAPSAPVAGVTVDRPCSVIVQEQEKEGILTVCVAEPERTAAKIVVQVTPKQTGYRLQEADPTRVTVAEPIGTTITLTIMPGAYGRTMTARFTRPV